VTFIVQTSAAAMPHSCWGTYRRVAVLEVDPGARPAMISERARGVRRVVAMWEKLNVGKVALHAGLRPVGRCAWSRAMIDAAEMAEELNR